ncbi:MAG: phage protein Gp27 family protein [Bilophila sp.]
MGRKSSLKKLPPEIYNEINRLLSEGRVTLDAIVEHLRTLGVDAVSRSALGRQKQKIDKVLERLRQSREVADAIAQKLGPEAVEGKQGRALVQLLSALAGEYMMRRLDDPEGEADAKEIMALARAVKDASQASRYSQDFEMNLRVQLEKEMKAKMDKAVEQVTGNPENTVLNPAQLKAKLLEAYGGA